MDRGSKIILLAVFVVILLGVAASHTVLKPQTIRNTFCCGPNQMKN